MGKLRPPHQDYQLSQLKLTHCQVRAKIAAEKATIRAKEEKALNAKKLVLGNWMINFWGDGRNLDMKAIPDQLRQYLANPTLKKMGF